MLNIGTYEGQHFIERERTIFLNRINLVGMISLLIVIFFFVANRFDTWIVAMPIINFLSAFGILYCQYKRIYSYAYVLVGIVYNFSITCGAVIMGEQAEMEYLLVVLNFVMIYFVFENRRLSVFYLGLSLLLFACIKSYFAAHPEGIISIEHVQFIKVINGGSIFLLVYFVADMMMKNRTNHINELAEKNNEIMQMNFALEQKVKERTLELKKQSEDLKHSNEDLTKFAYIAAHDLREPLRGIVSFSQLINKDILVNDFNRINTYNMYLNRAVLRVKQITDGMIRYTQLIGKERKDELINCNKLISQIEKTLNNRYPAKSTTIKRKTLPFIRMDKNLATLLFENLLDNAYLYTKTESIDIAITYRQEQGQDQFFIIDNEPGIALEYRESVFQLFHRLTKNETEDNIGVGLTMSKRIIEMYRGKIEIRAKEEGEGTVVFFSLPIEQ